MANPFLRCMAAMQRDMAEMRRAVALLKGMAATGALAEKNEGEEAGKGSASGEAAEGIGAQPLKGATLAPLTLPLRRYSQTPCDLFPPQSRPVRVRAIPFPLRFHEPHGRQAGRASCWWRAGTEHRAGQSGAHCAGGDTGRAQGAVMGAGIVGRTAARRGQIGGEGGCGAEAVATPWGAEGNGECEMGEGMFVSACVPTLQSPPTGTCPACVLHCTHAVSGFGGDDSSKPHPPALPAPLLPLPSQMLIAALEEMIARNVLANVSVSTQKPTLTPPFAPALPPQMLIAVLEEMVARNVLANAIAVLPVKSLSLFLQFCQKLVPNPRYSTCLIPILHMVLDLRAQHIPATTKLQQGVPPPTLPSFHPPLLPQFYMLAQVVGAEAHALAEQAELQGFVLPLLRTHHHCCMEDEVALLSCAA
ncbi:unnamed protein product [Closterium sp. NIES-64]|nr:unnamed protein product [Closterium sp. NIES-64]